ncbi:hypothetical protein [Streptosporangium canum]|uniref:hypothetical protein n=1 Tax=Streptosporangium canum TaxID=324952 RepID=UPI00379B6DA3
MNAPDDQHCTERMLAALSYAAVMLEVTPCGAPVWGWRRRTLGSRAARPDGGAV